jgi:malate/lactate dehydrogenase
VTGCRLPKLCLLPCSRILVRASFEKVSSRLADRVEPSRRLNVRSLEMVWTSRQSGYRRGTSMDPARFRRRLAERYGVASSNVHAYIVGEHGDSQIPVLSSARTAGVPLEAFCQQLGLPSEGNTLRKIASETRTAGIEIIGAKGATCYGIGAALVRIVRAILRDEDAVLTVSSLVPESMQLGECLCRFPPLSVGTGWFAFYRSHLIPASENPWNRQPRS